VRGNIDKCLAGYDGATPLSDIKLFAFGETHFTEARSRTYRFPFTEFHGHHAVRATGNGGLALYIHASLKAHVVRTHVDPEMVFVSMGADEVLFVVLYAKPARAGAPEDVFEELARGVASVPQHRCTIVLGDANARTADRNREIEHSAAVWEQGPPGWNAGEHRTAARNRTSEDRRICARGKQCIQFCNTHHLDIANGCAPGSNNHACTFHSLGGRGQSVVDICLITADQFHRIRSFEVGNIPPDRCSDHSYLLAHIQLDSPVSTQRRRRPRKVIWQASEWPRYAESVKFNAAEVQKITTDMELAHHSDVSKVLTTTLRWLAGLTHRAFQGMQEEFSLSNGITWFDDECRQVRSTVQQERLRCIANGLPNGTSPELRVLTSRYHQLLKWKRSKAKVKDAARIARVSRRDPKAFWRWLHGTCNRHVPISLHTAHTYFTAMYSGNTNASCCTNISTTHPNPNDVRDVQALDIRMSTMHTHTTCKHDAPSGRGVDGGRLDACISTAEVIEALKALQNNRASGDGYPIELFKYAKTYDAESKTYDFMLAPFCTALFRKLFVQTAGIPQGLMASNLSLLYKGKGSEHQVQNYRGLAVGTALYKLYAAVLNKRLDHYLESGQLRAVTQCGFRRNHSTCTALFTLQHAIHSTCITRASHTAQPLYVCYIDFQRAFDSVQRHKLWHRLHQLGISGGMLKAIQNIYMHTPMHIKINGKVHTHPVNTAKGVKQGCPLSPTLFGTYIDQLHTWLKNRCDHIVGVQILQETILDIIYADDVALLATSLEDMNALCDQTREFCDENDMHMNIEKCAYTVHKPSRTRDTWPRGVHIRGQEVHEVESFKYLGTKVHGGTWFRDSLQHTTYIAANAMWALYKKLEKSDATPLDIKMHLFTSAVSSIASYGCQIWGVQYLDWKSEHHIFAKNPFQKLHLQYMRLITGAHAHVSRWVLLRELNVMPVQVEWAVACSKWWRKSLSAGAIGLGKQVMHQNIQLFKEGCKRCWTAMFLKCMSSLGLCGDHTADTLQELDASTLASLRFEEATIREAYKNKYERMYWDTTHTEPRGRSGRHAAFIKHNMWFHMDKNPVLKLQAQDLQVRRLVRFRIGTHKLRCNEHALQMHMRLCQLCDARILEDEQHVLLECTAYTEIRDSECWKSVLTDRYTGDTHRNIRPFVTQSDQYMISRYIGAILKERDIRMRDMLNQDIMDPMLP
jgi:hypothetical protein